MIPFLLLAVVELVCFGPFSSRLGFYHDDWANLERLANAGGLLGGIQYYTHVTLERPVGILQYPLLFAMGGLRPLPYQLFYLGAEIVEGWPLFILFDRLLGWRLLALLASALILIFPTHSVTHLWFSSAGMIVTVDLTLAALIFHHRWIEGGRKLDLAAGQLLYLIGVLNYEIAAFLPLLLAGGLLGRRRADGRPAAQQVHDELREFWPFAASLGAALLWQRAVVSVLLNRNPRLVGFSVLHALKAYQAGLECLANRATDVCARMIPVAWKGLGPVWAACALVFAAAWAFALLREGQPSKEQARRAFGAAIGAAAGGFIGACAPYAASADYLPMVFGVMSRTNGVISIAAGLLWATGAAVLFLRRRKAAAAVLAAVVFCVTFADWGYALQWARSWRLQTEILAKLGPRTAGLPADGVILLEGFPVSLEPGGALVFGAHYDIGAALRLTTGRKSLAADVITPASSFLPGEAVVFPSADNSVRRYSYNRLYVYDVGGDGLWRLTGPGRRTRISEAP